MSDVKIHIGDSGVDTVVRFIHQGLPYDVSNASSNNIIFKSPDGTVKERAATFVTDGTDGRIKYTLQSQDIDKPGIWKIWGSVTTLNGTRTSDTDYFAAIA